MMQDKGLWDDILQTYISTQLQPQRPPTLGSRHNAMYYISAKKYE